MLGHTHPALVWLKPQHSWASSFHKLKQELSQEPDPPTIGIIDQENRVQLLQLMGVAVGMASKIGKLLLQKLELS